MKHVVGIDRRIRRQWLDAVLDRLAVTRDEAELRGYLDQQLQAELPSGASRRKSCSILMKIWVRLPERSMGLRERALQLLPQISGQDRVWLHWGMTARAYPFFRDTAEVIGRLLALQDDFRGVGVQSRLTGAWGDRVTTKLAAGHLLRMLLDWDVLRTKSKSGQFLQVQKLTTGNRELQLWLLEALLGASAAEEIEAQQLLRLPESFPFRFDIGRGELRRHVSFNMHRQGLDMDMVSLRVVRAVAVPGSAAEPVSLPERVVQSPPRPRRGTLFDDIADAGLKTVTDAARAKSSRGAVRRTREQRQVAQQLNQEHQRTLGVRIERALWCDRLPKLPGAWSASWTDLCVLYRDGHFAGVLALGRVLLPPVLRAIAEAHLRRKPAGGDSVEKPLASLVKRGVLSVELQSRLLQAWQSPLPCSVSDVSATTPSASACRLEPEPAATHLLSALGELAAFVPVPGS